MKLVHSNICGPISPASSGNKKYFMTLIDDLSRKTWTYSKSEAFDCFKKFCAKTKTERRVKALRTNRSGEFFSNEFTKFCEKRIRRQLTAAYTPQQNGVAERKNRTTLNMVRCLLNKEEFSKEFWPKAVVWSVHILNRNPTFSVKDMTPQEAWSGRKPALDHFRIFRKILNCTSSMIL